MKLSEVLAGCGAEQTAGGRAAGEVTGVTADSRQVKEGDLFVALPGLRNDGAEFIGEAVSRGAVAVVAQRPAPSQVPFFTVGNARQALALIAANFYGKPAEELTLLGVTGTNGKTTVSYLLEAMAAAGGASTGLLGSIQYKFAGRSIEPKHTTPDPLTLHRTLREMVDAGIDTVIMEVSSHALAQERVHGLTYRAAGFTNLSRDHLDYHKDLEAYFQAKRKLFTDHLSGGGVAVINGDDTQSVRIYNELRGQKRMAWKFSREGAGEVSATDVQYTLDGIKATLKTPAGDVPVKSKLLGAHNLENIMCAAGMALGAGFSRRDVQDGIERVTRVPGRMERVEAGATPVLVDYAHTDDALRRSLEAARSLARGRVFVVFGCGGERDKGKRALMGQVAGELADVSVVTSDNPRSEDPEAIISEVTAGLEKAGVRRMSAAKAKSGERGFLVEADRRSAISAAMQLATPEDVVLIAGKGHETHQQVGDELLAFDDRLVAEEIARAARPTA
ncbi:MAG TPA: UDP-N-acetylmuramoyl-L-alanyl-D-glutamate--2,6-diaminopimelate ligase [Myxococcaceae bacterium]|nr:UDP-N-acetylmuramoyl-L-alanyl-D-glutamate--2,6-diaminopimelate ligase [Myxococcaceae bacterium]